MRSISSGTFSSGPAGTPASSGRSTSAKVLDTSHNGVKPKSRLIPFKVWAARNASGKLPSSNAARRLP